MLFAAFAATAHFDQISHVFDLSSAVIVDVGIAWTRGFRLYDDQGASAGNRLKFLFIDSVILIHVDVHVHNRL